MIPSPSEKKRTSDRVGDDVIGRSTDPESHPNSNVISPVAASIEFPSESPTEADFEQCREGLRCFLKSRLGQESDVEDCLQNVSLKWIKHREGIPRRVVRAWLFTVAANEATMVWRKHSRSQHVLQSLAGHTHEQEEPEDALDRRETQEVIRRAVSRLPEDMQVVVKMRLESDATFEQIAERLGIPIGTALSRMHRALAKLEKDLEPLN